jgi:hypothetical protein
MTVNFIPAYYTYQGLSTDTKPTSNITPGSEFWELDTGKLWIYSTTWTVWTGADSGNLDLGPIVTLSNTSVTGNSADLANTNAKGVIVGINLTAVTGTLPTLVTTIQGKDTASGTYYNMLSSVSIGATGFIVMSLYPTLSAVTNLVSNSILPKTWRVVYTIGGAAPSFTGTIGACLIA